jgi:hypothetical protein
VVLGAPFASVGRIKQITTPLGAHRAGVEDQGRIAAQHADQHAMDLRQHADTHQLLQMAAKVEPLALPAVAVRLRHGVPSRRNCRKVASTRTVADRG